MERKCNRKDPSVGGNVRNRIGHRLHNITAYAWVRSGTFSLQSDIMINFIYKTEDRSAELQVTPQVLRRDSTGMTKVSLVIKLILFNKISFKLILIINLEFKVVVDSSGKYSTESIPEAIPIRASRSLTSAQESIYSPDYYTAEDTEHIVEEVVREATGLVTKSIQPHMAMQRQPIQAVAADHYEQSQQMSHNQRIYRNSPEFRRDFAQGQTGYLIRILNSRNCRFV